MRTGSRVLRVLRCRSPDHAQLPPGFAAVLRHALPQHAIHAAVRIDRQSPNGKTLKIYTAPKLQTPLLNLPAVRTRSSLVVACASCCQKQYSCCRQGRLDVNNVAFLLAFPTLHSSVDDTHQHEGGEALPATCVLNDHRNDCRSTYEVRCHSTGQPTFCWFVLGTQADKVPEYKSEEEHEGGSSRAIQGKLR